MTGVSSDSIRQEKLDVLQKAKDDYQLTLAGVSDNDLARKRGDIELKVAYAMQPEEGVHLSLGHQLGVIRAEIDRRTGDKVRE